jgi:hypothetical protein
VLSIKHDLELPKNGGSPKLIIPIGSVAGVTNFSGSPNGDLLLCEDEASHIIIYGTSDLKELQRLEFEGFAIKSSVFLDDSTVIFISNDTNLVQWDLYSNEISVFRSMKQLRKLIVYDNKIYCIDKDKYLNSISFNLNHCEFTVKISSVPLTFFQSS